MAELVRISSGTPWEPVVGYSRAVKAGGFVAVSGTTATDEAGRIVGAGQMYVQARQALTNIAAALKRIGLSMRDVARTRIYTTDIARFSDVARAHREFFGDSPPACTMVEVRRLVHPDMLIEIEADAWAGPETDARPAAGAQATAAPAPRPKTPPAAKAAPSAKAPPKPKVNATKRPAPKRRK